MTSAFSFYTLWLQFKAPDIPATGFVYVFFFKNVINVFLLTLLKQLKHGIKRIPINCFYNNPAIRHWETPLYPFKFIESEFMS
jgi:hypothetical protein